jgi:hypothetical protein
MALKSTVTYFYAFTDEETVTVPLMIHPHEWNNRRALVLRRMRNNTEISSAVLRTGDRFETVESPFYAYRESQTTAVHCTVCGCTDDDCSGCIERTGVPCYWVSPTLCSACVEVPAP